MTSFVADGNRPGEQFRGGIEAVPDPTGEEAGHHEVIVSTIEIRARQTTLTTEDPLSTDLRNALALMTGPDGAHQI